MQHIIIIGGSFGGLYAAKALQGIPARVSLIDRRNFHLFQPLLYQVATGALAAGDIAYPLREVFKRYPNFYVLYAEVVGIDPERNRVVLRDGELRYMVHIRYLIGFDNKLLVLFQWGWSYITQRRRSRLITGDKPFPVLNSRWEEKG